MKADEMRVWIGCLACYNAGRLVGDWHDAIDAGDVTPADIHEQMLDLKEAVVHDGDVFVMTDGPSPHEELWVMDHEGFGDLLTGECSPYEASVIAAKVEDLERECSYIPAEAIAAYCANTGEKITEVDANELSEHYQGEWDDLAHYAEDFCNDAGYEIKEGWPYSYIDWERAGRDLELGGDVWTADNPSGGIFVFSNH